MRHLPYCPYSGHTLAEALHPELTREELRRATREGLQECPECGSLRLAQWIKRDGGWDMVYPAHTVPVQERVRRSLEDRKA